MMNLYKENELMFIAVASVVSLHVGTASSA